MDEKNGNTVTMECSICPYYESCPGMNVCLVTGAEYFSEVEDCKLVNLDGTINEEALRAYRHQPAAGGQEQEEKIMKVPGQPAPNEVMFDAMKKQEPIAPRMEQGKGDCVRFFCPCCSNTRHHIDFGQKYCDECGQKLDWSPYRSTNPAIE